MTNKNNIQTLQAIQSFWNEYHFSPTIRDLITMLPTSSTSSTNYRLDKLEEEGYITKAPGLSRTIVITEKGQELLNAQAK